MMVRSADVVICGAGIAGVSAAYVLSVRFGIRNVVLIDDRAPLTLTSDKSTEAYRNWWPGPDDAMIRMMGRSIELIEELASSCDNRFMLNRRGYLYATADPDRADAYLASGRLASAQGAGPLRIHRGQAEDPIYHRHRPTGWEGAPDGADLILDQDLIHEHFPALADDVSAILHTRRCGWFSGQQLGMEQLERARLAGTILQSGRVVGVDSDHRGVSGVRVVDGEKETTISTRCFVNAAGPMIGPVAQMLGLELPVFSELHVKMSFRDHLGVVPRGLPLLIWDDPQRLSWSKEEAEALGSSDETRWLLDPMPPGVHMRPEGREHVIILWPYHSEPVSEVYPIQPPPNYGEIALRGMTRLVPALTPYLDHLPAIFVDGGYYTKTRENRPLACPLPCAGAYLHGALSGFGMMASLGTAEILACHIAGDTPPDYSPNFDLTRYRDRKYVSSIDDWVGTSQL